MSRSLAVGHMDPRITYTGDWLVLPDAHFTTEQNAMATFNFDGSALSIAGTTGVPPLSSTLDGQSQTFTFDSERSQILYLSPSLQPLQHVFSLRLLSNSSFLSIDGMRISIIDVAVKSPPPTIATVYGLIAAAIIIAALLLGLSIFFYRRKRHATVLNSAGPLRVALPTTKEAFTSRNCSTYGLSFLPYDLGPEDNLTELPPRKSRPRLKRPRPTMSPRRNGTPSGS